MKASVTERQRTARALGAGPAVGRSRTSGAGRGRDRSPLQAFVQTAVQPSDRRRTFREHMFVTFLHIHVLSHLHELLAVLLELVSFGEIRLRRRDTGAHRVDRGGACSNRALARRLAGGSHARPGRVVLLWPELDEALAPASARPARPAPPRPRARAAPGADRPASAQTRRADRRTPQPRRSASQSSPRLRRTMRTSPSSEAAIRCARSSDTPGRSSTKTSWSSS